MHIYIGGFQIVPSFVHLIRISSEREREENKLQRSAQNRGFCRSIDKLLELGRIQT